MLIWHEIENAFCVFTCAIKTFLKIRCIVLTLIDILGLKGTYLVRYLYLIILYWVLILIIITFKLRFSDIFLSKSGTLLADIFNSCSTSSSSELKGLSTEGRFFLNRGQQPHLAMLLSLSPPPSHLTLAFGFTFTFYYSWRLHFLF